MNWLFLFLYFNNKKNILVIAIVYLQFIFINLSMCSILTKRLYIYIYISQQLYMDFKIAKNSLHEFHLMQKKSHTNHTCKHNLTKHFNYITSMYTTGRTQRLNGLSWMDTDTETCKWWPNSIAFVFTQAFWLVTWTWQVQDKTGR